MYNKKYYHENKESINNKRKANYVKKYGKAGRKPNIIDQSIIDMVKSLHKQDVRIKTICVKSNLSYYHVSKIIKS